MKIFDLPREERPREKLLFHSPSNLSTAELVALIIRTGNQEKSALGLSEEIIAYSAELGGLSSVDVKELMKLDGMGESKACSLVAAIELGKRATKSTGETRYAIKNPSDAALLLIDELRDEKREHLVELILNVKGEIESKQIVSIGELTSTSVHPREVLSPAIRKGAAGIIIAHNHPSGDPSPSRDDISATTRLVEASKIIGIKLLDHLIIGKDSYVSLREAGYISD